MLPAWAAQRPTTVRRTPDPSDRTLPPPHVRAAPSVGPRLWTVTTSAECVSHNRDMLRLAPSHPPLWRTPSTLQLGTDAPVRVDGIHPWQERLIDALRDGIPDAMLIPLARSFGATDAEAMQFAARIEGALAPEPPAPTPVQVEIPDGLAHAELDALTAGWDAAGLTRVGLTRWASDAPQRGMALIVVAHRMLDPRRAARLMAADVTHVPVEIAGDRVHVGPVIVPGVTACAACLHAQRTANDPEWPLLAAQLLGREPVRTDPALLMEAALLTARLLRLHVEGAPNPRDGEKLAEEHASLSVGLSAAHARRTWHAHRPHAACLCRSPGGTGRAVADVFPNARTSSTTATARRA